MSHADASNLFKDGFDALVRVKASPNSPSSEMLLVRAGQCLDHAIQLIEEDDPDYCTYSQVCASASAMSVIQTDCSSELDGLLSSSPFCQEFADKIQRTTDNQHADLDAQAAGLEMFWNSLDDMRDHFYASRPELFSNRTFANHMVSFNRAIKCSPTSPYLQHLWRSFLAATLYLRMDRNNPDEIALCISLIRTLLDIGSAVSLPTNNIDSTLLQVLPELQHNVNSLKVRQGCLETLAKVYIHQYTATFRKYLDLYNLSSDPNQLDYAISEAREALSWGRDTGLLPELRFKLLVAAGRGLYERYRLNQLSEDLQDSTEYLREALTYESAPAERLIFCKQLLSTVTADLAKEFSEDPEPEIWLKSLELWRESIRLTGPEVPDLLVARLSGFASTAFDLYDRADEGNSDHVTEAAECLARAAEVATTPQYCCEVLFDRARVLYARFARENTSEDFDESLRSGAKAWQIVCQAPELAQSVPGWNGLYVYGIRMLRKIQEAKLEKGINNPADIQQLIQIFELIVPFPHTNRLNALNHLGRAYIMLYHSQVQSGQTPIECMPSLKKAVEYHQMALEGTPKDGIAIVHPRYTFLGMVNHELSRILELGHGSRVRYLELAINYFRQANHTQSLACFKNLAAALEDRYKLLGQVQDLHECIALLQTRHTSRGPVIGHPRLFFTTAVKLIGICRENNVNSHLIHAYRLLFQALRRISNMGMTSVARHQALVDNSAGHACDAAAAALAIDDPKAAIELLEDGRSLFFSQLVPMQTDTKRIHELDPRLASDLEYILEKLQQYSAETDTSDYKANNYHSEGGFAEDIDPDPLDVSPQSMHLRRHARQLQGYMDEIRELPGYEDFMRPKPFSRLKDAAQHCPVIYINVSQHRCDAIIIRTLGDSSQMTVVPLAVSWSQVYDLARTMQRTVKSQGRDVRDSNIDSTRHFVRSHLTKQSSASTVRNVLKQLWERVVKPVLQALGCLNGLHMRPEELQRVCWCPAGPAATFLPFHAAGNYDLGPEHWAITHIVSSYTLTLTSLLQAYERYSNAEPQPTRMLLVSLPATPPSNPLTCVTEERDGIIRAVGSLGHSGQSEVTVLHDSDGRVAQLKSMLPTHQLLHLACHGKQDKSNPLDSAILLHDGNLTLREIIKMPLPLAELVYLSACQTATGDVDSPDESLSLAGGFLFSGYRSAVATMWSINDKDGADVARAFYQHLTKWSGPLAFGAALALHHAIQDLRRANPNIELIRWIPFMCLGVSGDPK